ncbi:MAG: redoxin domain-containing protein [Candidatus Cyclobacteriaceae bacterium M3_2C_046]
MKNKVIIFFLLTWGLIGMSNLRAQENGYDIQVTIKNLPDTVCYLGYHFGDKQYVKDTSLVQAGGKVTFYGDEKLPGGIYFVYTTSIYFEILVNHDQHFSLLTDTVNVIENLEVVGSLENKLFKQLRVYVGGKQQEAAQIADKLKQAQDNESEKQQLSQQLQQIEKEVVNYQQGIVDQHPETLMAAVIKATQRIEVPTEITDQAEQFKYYKSHFFDHIDFTDARYLRTNFFHKKIMEFLEKLTFQQPDSISAAAQFLIDQSLGNEEMFRYLVVTLTSKYETSEIMGMDKVFVDLAEKYYLSGKASWADSTVMNKIKTKVEETKPNLIGNTAPALVLYDSLKRPVLANSLDSKFTILFFFDPDCGHCRKTAPELKKHYSTLKSLGAEVLGVSTITDLDAMQEFVDEFDLPWLTLADLRYQRKSYNIQTTPVIFVLDKDKKIIAKRLGVEQLEGFLKHQLEAEKKS